VRQIPACSLECIRNLLVNVASNAVWQPVSDWLAKAGATGAATAAVGAATGSVAIPLGIAGVMVLAYIGLRHRGAASEHREKLEREATLNFLRRHSKKLAVQVEQLDVDLQLNFKNSHIRFTRLEEMLAANAESTDRLEDYFRANEGLFISLEKFLLECFGELRNQINGLDAHINELARDLLERLTSMGEDVKDVKRLVQWLVDFQQSHRAEFSGCGLSGSESADRAFIEDALRRSVIAKLSMVRLIGIPGATDMSQVPLDSVFVAPLLQVRDEMASQVAASAADIGRSVGEEEQSSSKKQRKDADKEPLTLRKVLDRSSKLVIVGAPGSGKTTIARHIGLLLAKGKGSDLAADITEKHLPLLLTVRTLVPGFKKLPNPVQLVEMNVSACEGTVTGSHAHHVFSSGRCILIVDGLDECELPVGDNSTESIDSGKPTEWHLLMRWLKGLADAYPLMRIITTSRPVGYNRRGPLPGMELFQPYKIRSLSAEQQEIYVENWCTALANVERRLSGQEPTSASDITAKLRSHIQKSPTLKALAHTPITLSVLCLLQAQAQLTTRERLAGVLMKCVDALLYEWRNAVRMTEAIQKDLAGKLDAPSQRALLEPVAFLMKEAGTRSIRRDTVVSMFAERLPALGHEGFEADGILQSMRDRGGVFVEGSPGEFEWTHDLFMEFLAGQDCASRQDLPFLNEKADDPKWREVIPFALSQMRFAQQTFIGYCLEMKHTELAARVMKESVVVAGELRERVLNRAASLAAENPMAGLPALIAINDKLSASRFLGTLMNLVPVSREQMFAHSTNDANYAADKLRFDILQLARRTARRCCYNTELTISGDFADTRGITYDGVEDSEKAASWIFTSINIVEKFTQDAITKFEAKVLGAWQEDPIYSFAILLDTLGAPTAFDEQVLKDGLEILLATQEPMSPEHRLLIINVVHYAIAKQDKHFVSILMKYLASLPRTVCPANQLGMINRCMEQWAGEIPMSEREAATKLWKECVASIVESVSSLIGAWSGGYIGPTDTGVIHSDEERVATFKAEFYRELSKYTPFAFDTLESEDADD
jgi:hypothetical protein